MLRVVSVWRGVVLGCVCVVSQAVLSQEPAKQVPKGLAMFLEQHCTKCHDSETKKGELDFSALPYDLGNPALVRKWTEVFDRVVDREMPPPKKTQPREDERVAFLKGLKGDLQAGDSSLARSIGRVQSRRLTRAEFERSVQDLLGLYMPFLSHLPDDPLTDGFNTVAKGQEVSSNQLETYLEVIDEALDAAFGQALSSQESWKKTFGWQELQRQNIANVNVSRGPEGRPAKQDVVSWHARGTAFDFYGRMEATKVPADGWYRIRVRALGVNVPAGERISASIFSGRHISSAPERHLVGAIEADETPADYEFFSWMKAKELLRVQVCDDSVPRPPAGRHPENREMLADLEGKGFRGIAVQSVEMERVYPGFKPDDTRRFLFGELAVKPLAVAVKSASGGGGQRTIDLEVVAKDPEKDLQKLIWGFANRAFRRPVKLDEVRGYLELAKAKLETGASFSESLKPAYRSVLMSPRFFYFEEAPGPLNAHAIASRLSFFFWGAPPDVELRALADSGKLLDPAVLHAQVDRMLLHGNAKRFIRNFTDQWLKLREIDATNPDEKLYEEFDDLLKDAMVEETQTFFWDLIKRDLSVKNVVDSNHTFLNNRLAKHYGIPALPKGGMQLVQLKPEYHRGGIITQASVMKVTANGTTTSPVVRGVWLLEKIAGQRVPPPPASVPAIEPDIRGAKTIREQLEKHRADANCAACHMKMDPPGFALENYDVIGGWRQSYRAVNEKGMRKEGLKVDASYHFPNGEGFQDVNDLKHALLKKPEVLARNLVRQFVTFSTGASPSFADRDVIEAIVASAKPRDYGVRTLLHATIGSPIFLNK